MSGWPAGPIDPDDPAAELSVAVYVDDGGITWFDTGVATAGCQSGVRQHRKSRLRLPGAPAPGSHSIAVYAINVAGGRVTRCIGNQDVTL